MMKQLILNADDLGSDINRNRGIFETLEAGMVKSVSILANGPALEDAIKRIKSMNISGVSFGVHINLSEGRPLSEKVYHLTGKDGNFLSKKRALTLLSGQTDNSLKEEIEAEMDAQIKRILEYGIDISHMDGHHHIHVMPSVIETAVKKAREHNIRWMRIPVEPVNAFNGLNIDEPTREEAIFFSHYALSARPYIKMAGINTTDYFIGLYLKGRLSSHVFLWLSKNLREGVTEMMVHPGYGTALDPSNPFTCFSTKQREDELNALVDPQILNILKRSGIHIKSFVEVDR